MHKFTIHKFDLYCSNGNDEDKKHPVCQAFTALYERAKSLNGLIGSMSVNDMDDELLIIGEENALIINNDFNTTNDVAKKVIEFYIDMARREGIKFSDTFELFELRVKHDKRIFSVFYAGKTQESIVCQINERTKAITLAGAEVMVRLYEAKQRAEFATMKGERGEEMD